MLWLDVEWRDWWIDCRRMYCAVIYMYRCICIMMIVVWCIQFCDRCFAWEHVEVKCETCRYLDCRNSMKLLVVQSVCWKYGTLFAMLFYIIWICAHMCLLAILLKKDCYRWSHVWIFMAVTCLDIDCGTWVPEGCGWLCCSSRLNL